MVQREVERKEKATNASSIVIVYLKGRNKDYGYAGAYFDYDHLSKKRIIID
jgi:hypothetical protein